MFDRYLAKFFSDVFLDLKLFEMYLRLVKCKFKSLFNF